MADNLRQVIRLLALPMLLCGGLVLYRHAGALGSWLQRLDAPSQVSGKVAAAAIRELRTTVVLLIALVTFAPYAVRAFQRGMLEVHRHALDARRAATEGSPNKERHE
jgi:ABC-type sulfate transport system permease component